MSCEERKMNKKESGISIPEILFGALLGFGAVSGIWASSTILLHLFQNLN
jgi:hypothetical protein